MSWSDDAASKRGVTMTVWPRCRARVALAIGAEWYSGDVTRCTPPPTWATGSMPKRRSTYPARSAATSGVVAATVLWTPFGRPDVPDV